MRKHTKRRSLVTIRQTGATHYIQKYSTCFIQRHTAWVVQFHKFLFPQQRKLMGSSAQISSGVCRCGSQEQVPEEGSGRFRRVPVCAGVGSGGRFRKVPESSGVCWRRFWRQVPEGCVPVCAGSGGRFRRHVQFRCALV